MTVAARMQEALEGVVRPQAVMRRSAEVLRDLLNLDSALSYSLAPMGRTARLDTIVNLGGPADAKAWFDSTLGETRRFGHYDPLAPVRWQRNRVLTFNELERRGSMSQSMQAYFRRTGLHELDQLRVLLCEGPVLLAWVGGFREEPFSSRDKAVLRTVAPVVQQRLLLGRRLEVQELASLALSPAMEAISMPALLITAQGSVRMVNKLAERALNREPSRLLDKVQSALRTRLRGANAKPAGVDITALNVSGCPTYFLVVVREAQPHAYVEKAASRWHLTPRQSEVLSMISEGLSNKTIAAVLGLVEGTVELHVSAILAKAGAESRAELVARVWTER